MCDIGHSYLSCLSGSVGKTPIIYSEAENLEGQGGLEPPPLFDKGGLSPPKIWVSMGQMKNVKFQNECIIVNFMNTEPPTFDMVSLPLYMLCQLV